MFDGFQYGVGGVARYFVDEGEDVVFQVGTAVVDPEDAGSEGSVEGDG